MMRFPYDCEATKRWIKRMKKPEHQLTKSQYGPTDIDINILFKSAR